VRFAAATQAKAARAELAKLEAEVPQGGLGESLGDRVLAEAQALLDALHQAGALGTTAGSTPEPVKLTALALATALGEARRTADAQTEGESEAQATSRATYAETVAATVRGEVSLDEVADAAFGDATFDDAGSEDDEAVDGSEPPALRQRAGSGSRTPPRARGAKGKGAGCTLTGGEARHAAQTGGLPQSSAVRSVAAPTPGYGSCSPRLPWGKGSVSGQGPTALPERLVCALFAVGKWWCARARTNGTAQRQGRKLSRSFQAFVNGSRPVWGTGAAQKAVKGEEGWNLRTR
jgi:hypothetical protein